MTEIIVFAAYIVHFILKSPFKYLIYFRESENESGEETTQNTAKKAKRMKRFTDAEMIALTSAVRERIEVISERLNPKITFKTKKLAWEEITKEVNAVTGLQRTSAQVQEKWRNLKKQVKSTESSRKEIIAGTGGGLGKLANDEPWYDNVLATLSAESIHGIKGGIDTSDPGNIQSYLRKI